MLMYDEDRRSLTVEHVPKGTGRRLNMAATLRAFQRSGMDAPPSR